MQQLCFFILFALGKWQLALRIEIILGIMVVQGLSDVDLYVVKSWQLFTSSWQFLCRKSRKAKEMLNGVNVILTLSKRKINGDKILLKYLNMGE